jgi:Leucine-rich repeat (LRR) protein
MLARSLRDLVSCAPEGALVIQAISLKGSSDLVCRNIFCDKVGQPCLCKLEHALSSPRLDLSMIRTINLSSNGLTALPPSLERMINLEELDLSENSLTALPSFLPKLEKLSLLNLSANPLEGKLPSSILTRKEIFAIPEALFLSS